MSAAERWRRMLWGALLVALPGFVGFKLAWLPMARRDDLAFQGFGLSDWMLWALEPREAVLVVVYVLICFAVSGWILGRRRFSA